MPIVNFKNAVRYFVYVFLIALFFSCNNSKPGESSPDIHQEDQEQILKRVVELYEWNDSIGYKTPDHTFIAKDSLYLDLDRKALAIRLDQLKATDFFSEEFLKNFESFGNEMEKQLKTGTVKYYVGDVPPFGLDASPWCNCQDAPENYIQKLQLENLIINADSSSFNWTWGDGFRYKMKMKKESGEWKVSYMEGFDIANLK